MLALRNILRRDEVCFAHECAIKAQNSHLWARYSPHDLQQRVDRVRFVISVWAEIIAAIVVSPYLLPNRLTAQRYRDFVESVLTELPEDVPLSVR
jgi:ferric iron reductase protein FhuF